MKLSEMTKGKAHKAASRQEREFVVKKSSKDGQFYWSTVAKNGEATFSGEGHPDEDKAIRAIRRELSALGATIPVVIHVDNGKETTTKRFKPAFTCPPPTERTAVNVELGGSTSIEDAKKVVKSVQRMPTSKPSLPVVGTPPTPRPSMAMPVTGEPAHNKIAPPKGKITMGNTPSLGKPTVNLDKAVEDLKKKQIPGTKPSAVQQPLLKTVAKKTATKKKD